MSTHQFFYLYSKRDDGDMRKKEVVHQWIQRQHVSDRQLVMMKQVHGTTIHRIQTNETQELYSGVDGVIARNPTNILGILTADCLPIFFHTSHPLIFAGIHAGWRGVFAGIVDNTVHHMIDTGANLQDIHMVIGPHIQSCCYSVNKERIDQFRRKFDGTGIIYRDKIYYLSLQEIVGKQAKKYGIAQDQIHYSSICTSCHADEYFSYRKDSLDSFGEQISVIGVKQTI